MSSVVCPPYDVISPRRQEYFHDLDPNNFIRIILGKDVPGEDKYKRSAEYFNDWLKKKVLIQDEKPAVYFYSQQYNLKGETKTRYGFIALLYLGDDKSPVYGHEHTHLEAKEDRLRLLKAVRANLSPIFVVFPDKKRIVQSLKTQCADKKPFIELTDDERTRHKLWKIDAPGILSGIQAIMAKEDIFIADGHHRFEVACAYRQELKDKLAAITGEEDFNYVMAYFTNTDPHGLTILPIHRLLKPDSAIDFSSFASRLEEYFHIEEIKDKSRFFFLIEKAGWIEHVLGMYNRGKCWLLRIKNIKILDKMIADRPPEYRSLDVSILNYIILKNILGLELEDKRILEFIPEANELIRQADENPSYIAFFLNPVKVQQIMAVAANGNKMPPKSTYFYPKVLSGLLINKLEGE